MNERVPYGEIYAAFCRGLQDGRNWGYIWGMYAIRGVLDG